MGVHECDESDTKHTCARSPVAQRVLVFCWSCRLVRVLSLVPRPPVSHDDVDVPDSLQFSQDFFMGYLATDASAESYVLSSDGVVSEWYHGTVYGVLLCLPDLSLVVSPLPLAREYDRDCRPSRLWLTSRRGRVDTDCNHSPETSTACTSASHCSAIFGSEDTHQAGETRKILNFMFQFASNAREARAIQPRSAALLDVPPCGAFSAVRILIEFSGPGSWFPLHCHGFNTDTAQARLDWRIEHADRWQVAHSGSSLKVSFSRLRSRAPRETSKVEAFILVNGRPVFNLHNGFHCVILADPSWVGHCGLLLSSLRIRSCRLHHLLL